MTDQDAEEPADPPHHTDPAPGPDDPTASHPDRLDLGLVDGDGLTLSYADALDELEGILAELEASSVDVDRLADRVARGAVLVRFCRGRLRSVRREVDAVVDELIDGTVHGDGV